MFNEVRYVRGAADARIQQPFNYPNLTVNVDRTRAQNTGLTQQNVTQGMLVALSGSFQTSPNFYLDPRNGITYKIAIQSPQYRLETMAEFESLPITGSTTSSHDRTLQEHFNGGSRRFASGQRRSRPNLCCHHRCAGRSQAGTGVEQPCQYRPRRRAGYDQPL